MVNLQKVNLAWLKTLGFATRRAFNIFIRGKRQKGRNFKTDKELEAYVDKNIINVDDPANYRVTEFKGAHHSFEIIPTPDSRESKDYHIFFTRFNNLLEKLVGDRLLQGSIKLQFSLKVTLTKPPTVVENKEDGETGERLNANEPQAEIGEYFIQPKRVIVNNINELPDKLKVLYKKITATVEDPHEAKDGGAFRLQGSGWVLLRIEGLYVDMLQHGYIAGGSYIELPASVQKSKSCINVKNEDDKCFEYALLAGIARKFNLADPKSSNRASLYNKFITKGAGVFNPNDAQNKQVKFPLDFTGVSFPVSVKDCKKVEELNNIAINVMRLNMKSGGKYTISPYYVSSLSRTNEKYTFDLLMLDNSHKQECERPDAHVPHTEHNTEEADEHKHAENEDDEDVSEDTEVSEDSAEDAEEHKENSINYHYAFIVDFNRLMFHMASNGDKSGGFFCHNCTVRLTTQATYDEHISACYNNEMCVIKMCDQTNNKIRFKNHKHAIKAPYVIYADFEAFTCPTDGDDSGIYQEHKAASYGYKVVSLNPEENKDFKYISVVANTNAGVVRSGAQVSPMGNTTDDVALYFLEEMRAVCSKLKERIRINTPMKLTRKEEDDFQEATHCHICQREFNEDGNNPKVRDHDHFTGKFRGAAHNKCNLNYRVNTKIPILFHNFKGYDSHLIMRKVCDLANAELDIIPYNMEKFLSLSVDKFMVFKDSLNFIATSLDKMVKSTDPKLFHMFNDGFSNLTEEQRTLIRKKGIFPYDWFNDAKKLDETKLPAKDDFYSELYKSGISDDEYKHAQNVWSKLGCSTFKDYHDLYLKTDVLLLADCMEAFRSSCYETYGLDIMHYYTLPGYTWDCMLRHNSMDQQFKNFSIEVFTDINMQLFIESGMRGGISVISGKHSSSTNPNPEDEKKAETTPTSILYIDMNNLYGLAMTQPLPIGGYKWDTTTWDVKKLMALKDDDKKGYVFEVDLKYPEELHDHHNDYPLAPETRYGEESPTMKNIVKTLGLKPVQSKKLIPNLEDKTKYIVHYRNLKYYVEQGLVITKFHRVIQFNQYPYLKSYIDKNTALRAKAKSDMEKDMFKAMNNMMFGKTMENVRKRTTIKLYNSNDGKVDKKLKKMAVSPYVERFKMIVEDKLLAVEYSNKKVVLNRPVIVGFSILETSKLAMYRFHYDKFKKYYGNNLRLLMTDTDSFIYEIKTPDLFKDIEKFKDDFDLSNLSKDHPLYDTTNNKVVGKMKIETGDVRIKEFTGIRSKCYSYIIEDNAKETKKCKGVKSLCVKTDIKHQDYKDALFNLNVKTVNFNTIQSKSHNITSTNVSKIAISPYDDKRLLCKDNNHTYAIGHYRVKNNDY